jgi:23S rRNA G2445 N2-methylase RlmL
MDPKDKEEIIEAISRSNDLAYQANRDFLVNSIKGFSDQLAQFEERNCAQHHEIISHQKETNGRVTCLENETRIFRWAQRNPKTAILISILILAGVIAMGIFLGMDNLLKLI